MSESFEELGYAVFDSAFAPEVIEDLRRDAERLRDDLLKQMIADQALDPRVTWWRLDHGLPHLLKIKPVPATAPARRERCAEAGGCRPFSAPAPGAATYLLDSGFKRPSEFGS
jgi:hypothetical protein